MGCKGVVCVAAAAGLVVSARANCQAQGEWTGARELDEATRLTVHWRAVEDEMELCLEAEGVDWIGFGLGENSAGHMLGGDIVTVEAEGEELSAKDRHVPWQAYPFAPFGGVFKRIADNETVEVETSPSLYPVMDTDDEGCANWKVEAGEKTEEMLWATVRRAMSTGDSHDRDFTPGKLQAVMWSYGTGGMAYHGARRGVDRIDFGSDGEEFDLGPCDEETCIELAFDDYELPAQETSYSCASFDLGPEARSIVAIEPLIDNAEVVHHFVVHVCNDSPDGDWALHVNNTGLCTNPEAEFGAPMSPFCETIMYAWAVGGRTLVLPEGVGFLAGDGGARHIVVETHYDNAHAEAGLRDSSGIRIRFSEEVQPIEAGMMSLGDTAIRLPPLAPGQENIRVTAQCPSECTQHFTEPITVLGAGLHAHAFARRMWHNRYNSSGVYQDTMSEISFWAFDHQSFSLLEDYVINPGDSFVLHADYDTSKWPVPIEYGLDSFDEMTLDFFVYYPKQVVTSCGQYTYPEPGSGEKPAYFCSGVPEEHMFGYFDPIVDTVEPGAVFTAEETCPELGGGGGGSGDDDDGDDDDGDDDDDDDDDDIDDDIDDDKSGATRPLAAGAAVLAAVAVKLY